MHWSAADIYEAKQLLKVRDDLADEGYTNLNNRMEADFLCLTRLRAVLQKSGASPFPVDHARLSDRKAAINDAWSGITKFFITILKDKLYTPTGGSVR